MRITSSTSLHRLAELFLAQLRRQIEALCDAASLPGAIDRGPKPSGTSAGVDLRELPM